MRLNEISQELKKRYKDKAQAQVKELEPHAKEGEYKDLAQRMITRRKKGLERVKDIEESVEYVYELKQRLDAKCWKGKHKEGTKIKGGIRVNNCVANESYTDPELANIKKYAQAHYPSLPPQVAFEKFVQRSLMHAKQADMEQDKRIANLEAELHRLKQMGSKAQ